MKWNQYDERLRKLYNAIATSHSETVSYATSEKLEKEASDLMEEITNLINKK